MSLCLRIVLAHGDVLTVRGELLLISIETIPSKEPKLRQCTYFNVKIVTTGQNMHQLNWRGTAVPPHLDKHGRDLRAISMFIGSPDFEGFSSRLGTK